MPAGVPAEVARRIVASPEDWLAWDEDGTILEAGVVQDFRFAALDATRNGIGRDAPEQHEARRTATDAATDATADPVVSAARGEVPAEAVLAPAVPNPAVGQTTLRFALPEAGAVRLAVYDVTGRRVAVLFEGAAAAGWHEAVFLGHGLASGLYVARLEAGGSVHTQRLTLVR
jgi:hypothetical protein